MSTVLVTGGCGFIGSHTAEALVRKGRRVRVLDALVEPVHIGGKPFTVPEGVELLRGDVRDPRAMREALEGVDEVFHFAAYQDYLPEFNRFFDVNVTSTALLYEIVVRDRLPVRKVVVASSQATLGEGLHRCNACSRDHLPDVRSDAKLRVGDWEHRCPECDEPLQPLATPESIANPQNPYGLSKQAQERLALLLGRRYDIPTVALRYSIVQGPRQSFTNAYSGACRVFCLSAHLGVAPPIYEDGRQLRDFVNIRDVVRANLLCLEDPRAENRVFHVGGGRQTTVRAFWEVVAREFGFEGEPRLTGQYRFGDTRHILSDITALGELGWKPEHTPERSVADYRAWLCCETPRKEILAYAERRMRDLGVVRGGDAD